MFIHTISLTVPIRVTFRASLLLILTAMKHMHDFFPLLASPILNKAKRKPLLFQCQLFNNQLLLSPSPLFEHVDNTVVHEQEEGWDKLFQYCEPIERFLEFKKCREQIDTESSILATTNVSTNVFEASTGEGNQSDLSSVDQYFVPVLDTVYPDSRRCCCFTKSYYRYVKGTGSLLATGQPKNKGKASSLKEQCLRYFTPREVANLLSFPDDFQFPKHISLRQRYALLGNR